MARYRATVETRGSREEVFAYLSDFSTAQEWDPGVIEATRLGERTGQGAEFALVARFLGRDTRLTYRVVEYDPPQAVTFVGENDAVVSRDRITFDLVGTGTRVSYDAVLTLKGAMRLLDPLLAIVFKRVGDRARAGMKHALANQRNTL